MQPTSNQTAAGWFSDPLHRYEYRWYNGTAWTADVSTNGERFVDPLGITNTPGMSRMAMPGTPRTVAPKTGAATASVILGVLAVLIAWIPFLVVIGLIFAVLAIVFGVSARRAAAAGGHPAGAGTAGIVTGIIGLLLGVVGVILTVFFVTALTTFMNVGEVSATIDRCSVESDVVTLSATLTNETNKTRSYTVFAAPLKGEVNANNVQTVADVDPSEARTFTMSFPDTSDQDGCDVRLLVQGPLPFGINVGPTNG